MAFNLKNFRLFSVPVILGRDAAGDSACAAIKGTDHDTADEGENGENENDAEKLSFDFSHNSTSFLSLEIADHRAASDGDGDRLI